MNDPHESQESNTYDHWKAITESDFVTLFIKTWFAFVATLRRMYPKDIPYYEAAGDYPYLRDYKSDFVEKFYFICIYGNIEESLHHVYKHGLEMTYNKYPRFLVDDFYDINNSYIDTYSESFKNPGGYEGTFELKVYHAEEGIMKVSLRCSDKKFCEKIDSAPEIFSFDVNYKDIIDLIIQDIEKGTISVSESGFANKFYTDLFYKASLLAFLMLDEKKKSIPEKGNARVYAVFASLQSFIFRTCEAMKQACLNPEIGEEHKLLTQKPVMEFLESYASLSTQGQQRAYLWFISYAYRLRNALFHEIIDPLDEEWQYIFKNAYLVLKQIVDVNITWLKMEKLYKEYAVLLFQKEFRDAPPPQIPIEKYDDTAFDIQEVNLLRYDATGAKVHIDATISCKGNKYDVSCNVKWNESHPNGVIKNVSISDPTPIIPYDNSTE